MSVVENEVQKNLYQRIAAVAAELKGLEVTGKNQYGVAALSIDDVESALAESFAKHGIATLPKTLSLEWDGKLWIKEISLTFVNADIPEERETVTAKDVGSNPAAADSFARKIIYKGLLHLPGDAPDTGAPQDAVVPGRVATRIADPTVTHEAALKDAHDAKGHAVSPPRRPDAQRAGPGSLPGKPLATTLAPDVDEFELDRIASLEAAAR